MDPDAFPASLFKWDPRGPMVAPAVGPAAAAEAGSRGGGGYWGEQLGGLEELFQAYGIRYYTAAKIAELGFTASTLVNMRDEELDDMMSSLSHIFRWDLLVGERYGVKAAVRAERRRLEVDLLYYDGDRRIAAADTPTNVIDAHSQEGLSEEPVQQEREMVGSGGGGGGERKKKQQRRSSKGVAHMRRMLMLDPNDSSGMMMLEENDAAAEDQDEDEEENDVVNNSNNSYKGKQLGRMSSCERQREHPFIVTEPGEVARGKKNGLDYLFHLYEQCRQFLLQVQTIAKERGEKCPTKVTNEVFRFAKKAGASHINKPKMRHYVHCYALHCLDEEGSNALRRAYKERGGRRAYKEGGENVGAGRQACYNPLVAIAARQAAWDIDSIFNAHPRLSIWYVPTKLRQLCHAERNAVTTPAAAASTSAAAAHHDHHHLSF
ncbi:Floricaula/leafy-like protein [Morus notabilis]|uniref:Floricaula/leafy-like transcription factor n=1 Tax=Morus notabilis TaxID=981085 RepID=W9RZX1_9ROSA|nr:floricaula/leafy homolog [Morus notabilis]EXC05171.1 Floricaula/leafy-like protein [Morus notabilis]